MTKPLTIVQLLPSLESGGVEKGTLEVAKAIVEAGHRSLVISAGGRLVEPLIADGSEHIQWDLGKKSPFTFLQARKLRQWLIKNNIDIIHARSRMPAWVAWLAWKKMPKSTRPRFITTMHGLNSVNRYSKIMSYGEKVIAVSETVENYLLKHYPDTHPDKIIVIPRGIDPEEFPFGYQAKEAWLKQWYQQFPQTQKKWILTLPGRLTRLKGHHDFIDVIQKLRKEIPNIHGLIVGGEDPKRQPYAQELYQKVKDHKLEETITFTGYQTEMNDIYSISNVILSLSKKPESFGRTVVEAISLGKPVVAYDHGGVGETLRHIYPDGLATLNDIKSVIGQCRNIHEGSIATIDKQQNIYLKQNMLDKTLKAYEDDS